MLEVSIVGPDMTKLVFQVNAAGSDGAAVLRGTCLVAMPLHSLRTCPCARLSWKLAPPHYWVREICKLCHDVHVIPSASVKPIETMTELKQ